MSDVSRQASEPQPLVLLARNLNNDPAELMDIPGCPLTDIEVELTPRAVANGQDPQLDTAVALVLAELKTSPPRIAKRPDPARRAMNDGSAET